MLKIFEKIRSAKFLLFNWFLFIGDLNEINTFYTTSSTSLTSPLIFDSLITTKKFISTEKMLFINTQEFLKGTKILKPFLILKNIIKVF